MEKRDAHKNNDIEVLRAVAISFTLISHLLWEIVPKLGGIGQHVHSAFQFWTGVDLFFAISGFLITTSLLKDRPDLRDDVHRERRRTWGDFLTVAKPFWIRRAFRLLPSAWLWIGLTLLAATVFNANDSLGPLHHNLREAAAALLNVANFYYDDWFSKGNSADGSFGIYWSLSLEEQFYALFPFLLFFLPRRLLLPGLGAAFLAQVFLYRPEGFHPYSDSLLWFIRTDALILGVLIAFWRSRRSYAVVEPRFLRRPVLAIPFVGLAVLLLAAVPALSAMSRFATGLVAILSGALVLIASYNRDYILPRGRVKTVFVWLGSRSYSIYLIHTTCRGLILELKRTLDVEQGSVAAALWTISSVVLTLVLAELNYHFVETRFREFGRRFVGKSRPRPAPVPINETPRPVID